MVVLNFDSLTTKQQADRALTIMKREASRERRKDMQKRIDYYYDKQLEYLELALENQFNHPDRLRLQKEMHNITQMIIDELAVLYNEEPTREIQSSLKGEDISPEDKDFYNDLMKAARINLVMQTASRLTKLCKTVLIRVVWRNERIEYDILTPNVFDVVSNVVDQTQLEAVVYTNKVDIQNDDTQAKKLNQDQFQENENDVVFTFWSKTNHFIFTRHITKVGNYEAQLIEVEGNPGDINPYGILPFIVLRDGEPLGDFWIDGGEDLIQANEINNVKLTETNNLTKMQAFGIPVRKGAPNAGQELSFDPSLIIDIPADQGDIKGADFKFVSPDAKIEEMHMDCEKRIKRTATKNNLNPERFSSSGQKSSAAAMQLRAADQNKILQQDKPFYRDFEKEIFEVTRVVNNFHNTKKIPDSAELFIDFKDVEVPVTVEDQDAHNILMFNNGLLSKAQWLIDENPDVRTIDQALQMLVDIEKQNTVSEIIEGDDVDEGDDELDVAAEENTDHDDDA